MLRSKWFWFVILFGFIIAWSMFDLFVIVPNLDS
ncbi:hypothetical protein SAMN05880501_11368 [Ureibacillus xyleni]|uniref:Uncharacterized protein n=1 Tax=Ureibacillus xyleni TaxID=614648 RepID=A0A285TJ54_9BACL|nr:hypothetical protein SAMN05880501_11368 [Ureibacillus xyleni]